jgi:hypothetical protein
MVTERGSSMVQTESGAAMVNVAVCDKGTDLATSNLYSCDKKETTPSDARENDSAANKKNKCNCIADNY